jgi:hypothetical protein
MLQTNKAKAITQAIGTKFITKHVLNGNSNQLCPITSSSSSIMSSNQLEQLDYVWQPA